MAGRDDLIKYVTQQVVTYIDTPEEERRQKRQAAKAAREPWLTKWFGMAPVGIALWWRARKDRTMETEQQELVVEK
ncbi:YqzE family protein [Paenibacillus methanolicus]|uniref:YqzE-like protein n=1 Tax=Paenibacillus methanolicus TaxID=582686 RepID=A0A5S5C6X9_9BACL|nr:YqzE family protein [Paenibacillus methanolicus]TYP73733.1 YqzE-like protein [Paenibacillus methanolicus]